MMREYEMFFGHQRYPTWPLVIRGGVEVVDAPINMDMLDYLIANGTFEPCNCPAYPDSYLHTWGIGRCYRPQYWCGQCGEPCGVVEEDGEKHAPNLRNQTLTLSDCCRGVPYHDYRCEKEVAI